MALEELDQIEIAESKAISLAGATRIGLGCMALTGIYGSIDREQAVATLAAALDQGVKLFDTAPLYGNGKNEQLLGEVLGDRRDATIVTKFGLYADKAGRLYRDSRPETIRQSVDASLRRLKRARIDVLLQHRTDPETSNDDVQDCIAGLIAAGKVGEFGISSVSAKEIARLPITGSVSVVQNELSLVTGPKRAEIEATAQRGAAFMAFSPLGRGILTDSRPSRTDDLRTSMSAFTQIPQAAHHTDNDSREAMASAKEGSVRKALSWVLAQGKNVIVIPGCRSSEHVSQIFRTCGKQRSAT